MSGASTRATLAACGPGPVCQRAGARRLDRRLQRATRAPLPVADHHRLLARPRSPRPAGAWPRIAKARALLGAIPEAIPDGEFDLVVASEILYYLEPAALDGHARRLLEARIGPAVPAGLRALARPPGPERPLHAAEVHELGPRASPGLRQPAATTTDDYLLDVLERR